MNQAVRPFTRAIFLCLALVFAVPRVGFPGTFVDALGRKVVLKRPPKRIISLAPSITETLYYLGLGDRVVGVTTFSNYPPQAALKRKVGSYAHLNVESILELNPDLVIGTKDGNDPNVVGLLVQAGIPVYIVNPRHVEDVAETLRSIAEVCGISKRGNELAELLSSRVKRVREVVSGLPRPVVFLQINIKPIISVGRDAIHNDVIRLAGGINMMQDAPNTYPTVSLEEVLARKPDVIIISCMERGGRFEKARQAWMQWRSIPAVRNHRVYLVDSDIIDRPAPRIIKGLEIVAELLHPELKGRLSKIQWK